jgi:cytochrome c2
MQIKVRLSGKLSASRFFLWNSPDKLILVLKIFLHMKTVSLAATVITVTLLLAHCTQADKKAAVPTVADTLPVQSFTIAAGRDTSILTKDSILFSFEKGSFSTTAKTVTVVIKEALHLSDMLKAKLTTTTDGEILQSGGMFNIEAAAGGNPVQLQKSVEVKVPTYKYRDDMLLYKGEMKDNKLNWVAPQPLLNKAEQKLAVSGKKLFMSNCANCHKIDKDATGPAMAYITERRCYEWLKDFVRNSTAMNDPIARCVKQQWKNAAMTSYGNGFSNQDFDSLYGYIAAESKKYPRAKYFANDNCRSVVVKDTLAAWDVTTIDTKSSKGFNKTTEKIDTAPPLPAGGTLLQPQAQPEPIEYPRNNAYYQFTIETTGWYNIDMLYQAGANVQTGTFKLQVQEQYKTRFEAYLVIPGRKILLEGHTTDNRFFYFKNQDFTLPLPIGESGLVYIMGEEGQKALWARQFVTFTSSQTIVLQPAEVPDIAKELDKLQIDRMEYSVSFKKTERRYDIIERLYTSKCNDEPKTAVLPLPDSATIVYEAEFMPGNK